jgi:hypothetical protein
MDASKTSNPLGKLSHPTSIWLGLPLMVCLLAPGQAQSPEPIDFNRDIRPILSETCFKCHGFDAQQRKAELRLDTWEGLTDARQGRVPVRPGAPESSEVLNRIFHENARKRMPPRDSGKKLTDSQKSLIRRWVLEGAAYSDHWAFVPPKDGRKEEMEGADSDWCRTQVDEFILRELQKHSYAPSSSADRRST